MLKSAVLGGLAALALAAPALAQPAWQDLPAIHYRVLRAAAQPGPSPRRHDVITINYELKLADGRLVETTFGKAPASFPLDRLIPGWQVVLPLMHVGDEWEIQLPPQFAYGAAGNEAIPANSTLDFRIELLGIEPAQ